MNENRLEIFCFIFFLSLVLHINTQPKKENYIYRANSKNIVWARFEILVKVSDSYEIKKVRIIIITQGKVGSF